jgi:hypothetical protein
VVIAFLVWWGNTERPPVTEKVAMVTPDQSFEEDLANTDSATVDSYRGDMILTSLGFGEMSPDGYGGPPPAGDWDDPGLVAAAVAPSDANVLMLMNNNAADPDSDAAPDDEAIYQ